MRVFWFFGGSRYSIPMNEGQATLEWLFSEQLRIDREWSTRDDDGFTWWPFRHAAPCVPSMAAAMKSAAYC